MTLKFPFKNLVFKGGGVKAFAYNGALEVFENHGILSNIQRVAGTSAGSMMAMLISFKLPLQETIKLMATLDYTKITPIKTDVASLAESGALKAITDLGEQFKGSIGALSRLQNKFGLFPSYYLREWLEEIIAAQCNGNGRATFADFEKHGFRELHVAVTNISTHTIMDFCATSTPHVAVADACIASSTIPFFFDAQQFDGDSFGQGEYLVDGGVIANYPIQIFDGSAYKEGNQNYAHGVNWETLGCRLYTPRDCSEELDPITDLISYIKNLIATLSVIEEQSFMYNLVDKQRTISISNCCVEAVDFQVKPGTPKYDELVKAGKAATQEFLENYTSPMDKDGKF